MLWYIVFNKSIDAEDVLKDSNQVETGMEIVENKAIASWSKVIWKIRRTLCLQGIDTYTVAASVNPYVFFSKLGFYRPEPP